MTTSPYGNVDNLVDQKIEDLLQDATHCKSDEEICGCDEDEDDCQKCDYDEDDEDYCRDCDCHEDDEDYCQEFDFSVIKDNSTCDFEDEDGDIDYSHPEANAFLTSVTDLLAGKTGPKIFENPLNKTGENINLDELCRIALKEAHVMEALEDTAALHALNAPQPGEKAFVQDEEAFAKEFLKLVEENAPMGDLDREAYEETERLAEAIRSLEASNKPEDDGELYESANSYVTQVSIDQTNIGKVDDTKSYVWLGFVEVVRKEDSVNQELKAYVSPTTLNELGEYKSIVIAGDVATSVAYSGITYWDIVRLAIYEPEDGTDKIILAPNAKAEDEKYTESKNWFSNEISIVLK